jgi:hypothetical protein
MADNEAFDNYLKSLDSTTAQRLTIEIRRRCGNLSRYTIYNWRSGRTVIRPLYKSKINEVIGTPIFDVV